MQGCCYVVTVTRANGSENVGVFLGNLPACIGVSYVHTFASYYVSVFAISSAQKKISLVAYTVAL